MIKLVKDGGVKLLDEKSNLVSILKNEGWKVDGEKAEAKAEVVDGELEALRAEAAALGLNVHHRTGVEKLKEMIEEAKK